MDEKPPIQVELIREDHVTIIRPLGDIDLASSPSLRSELRSAVDAAKAKIIVDLEGVPYMDSSGVATLVELLQSCRRENLKLVLCQLTSRVRSVFEIARLDGVFTITASLDDARVD